VPGRGVLWWRRGSPLFVLTGWGSVDLVDELGEVADVAGDRGVLRRRDRPGGVTCRLPFEGLLAGGGQSPQASRVAGYQFVLECVISVIRRRRQASTKAKNETDSHLII
jgi:hypothetical protein